VAAGSMDGGSVVNSPCLLAAAPPFVDGSIPAASWALLASHHRDAATFPCPIGHGNVAFMTGMAGTSLPLDLEMSA
jgi:hypothetical protein